MSPNLSPTASNDNILGPGQYDLPSSHSPKQSFNLGSVPLGGQSNCQFLYGSRVTHNNEKSPSNFMVPGPGAYNTIEADAKINIKKRSKLSVKGL